MSEGWTFCSRSSRSTYGEAEKHRKYLMNTAHVHRGHFFLTFYPGTQNICFSLGVEARPQSKVRLFGLTWKAVFLLQTRNSSGAMGSLPFFLGSPKALSCGLCTVRWIFTVPPHVAVVFEHI